MQTEALETWNKLCQQTLENLRKMGEANMKLGEKLWAEQIALTNAVIEATTTSAEQLSKAKDLTAGATLQAELAQEVSKQVVESCRSCSDIVAEAGKVYNQIFEKGVAAASDNWAGASAKTAKRKSA